jgi:hypothetical protein
MAKHGDVTMGQVEAVINKIGREVWDAILRDEVTLKFGDLPDALNQPADDARLLARVEEIPQILFDKNGRRILKGRMSYICDPNIRYHLARSNMSCNFHYADRLSCLNKMLVTDAAITSSTFSVKIDSLVCQIKQEPTIANILNGTWLPIVVPQLKITDIGTIVKQLLGAAGKSYKEIFPSRE